jgi:hypothetical protein
MMQAQAHLHPMQGAQRGGLGQWILRRLRLQL